MLKYSMALFNIIIPAAGFGSRMGVATPKQYLDLAGEAVITHTLRVFLDCPRIASVNLILSQDDAFFKSSDYINFAKLNIHYCGGTTRAETVFNGLQALSNKVSADDWILVHDAARPCLNAELLNNLLDVLQDDTVGGLLAIPLAETLKRADANNKVAKTEARENLWQAQTPQMFRYGLLIEALQNFNGAPTDEAQAVEALGYAPTLVRGDLRNLKITYPQDLALAELILGVRKESIE